MIYNDIKLAWRNIWRNKRRTFITIASIFFAIFFALIMRAIQIGSYSNMIDNVVQTYTGHIQIHKKGYWDDKTINNTFQPQENLINKIEKYRNVSSAVPRLESFALGSSGLQTKGVFVVGVNPAKEDKLTNVSDKIIEGQYLSKNSDGLLLAENLAKYLKLKVNDTIVFISQGYHGISAAGKYPIRGLLHFPTPDFNNSMVYMNLEQCQELYSAYGMLSSIAIGLIDNNDLEISINDIENIVNNDDSEIMGWKKLLPELVQQIEVDNAGGIIMLGILYIIVAFGIFGTALMMTAERKKEFGVMIAIGMQKTKLSIIVIYEMIFIGIMGVIAGMIGAIPIILNFYINPIKLTGEYAKTMENFGIEPIMPAAWQIDYILNQSIIIFIIMLIAIIYPIFSISKIKVSKALRA
ncbi:MAG: ABC transporter permease [Bacteroidales bacterium]|jgi:ABC-type lipoprotein release transport system permease subunit|nr:ABC transporter permease [Bacteroidales bacterium]